ncbi:hypothetical protein BDZ88DRAFT_447833 [Geranomyces variabilis]|nr:hypothetical protein BDZ88DRAFT_447833 [Geranomyces variabilis]KAJ3143009.1 hypothetical protein HDU90_002883 [Geranomyces variabilis]
MTYARECDDEDDDYDEDNACGDDGDDEDNDEANACGDNDDDENNDEYNGCGDNDEYNGCGDNDEYNGCGDNDEYNGCGDNDEDEYDKDSDSADSDADKGDVHYEIDGTSFPPGYRRQLLLRALVGLLRMCNAEVKINAYGTMAADACGVMPFLPRMPPEEQLTKVIKDVTTALHPACLLRFMLKTRIPIELRTNIIALIIMTDVRHTGKNYYNCIEPHADFNIEPLVHFLNSEIAYAYKKRQLPIPEDLMIVGLNTFSDATARACSKEVAKALLIKDGLSKALLAKRTQYSREITKQMVKKGTREEPSRADRGRSMLTPPRPLAGNLTLASTTTARTSLRVA